MPTVSGQRLWTRQQLTLQPGDDLPVNDIDTGITQKSLAFGTDPPLNGAKPSTGIPDGIASRVQVIPLCPINYAEDNWKYVTHDEPRVVNGTVRVQFHKFSGGTATINLLFWAPHSEIGPGDADIYGNPL